MAECIQSISAWNSIRIHFLSIIFGIWVLCKKFIKWTWNSKGVNSLQLRDNPPSCLLDSYLGHHKYVKLKVSFIILFLVKRIASLLMCNTTFFQFKLTKFIIYFLIFFIFVFLYVLFKYTSFVSPFE